MSCWHDGSLQGFRMTWFWAPKFETMTIRVTNLQGYKVKRYWRIWKTVGSNIFCNKYYPLAKPSLAKYPEMNANIKRWWGISEISQQLEVKESFPISARWSTQKQDHPSSLSRSTTDSQTICFVTSENSNSEIKAIVYGRIAKDRLLMKIAACWVAPSSLVWS